MTNMSAGAAERWLDRGLPAPQPSSDAAKKFGAAITEHGGAAPKNQTPLPKTPPQPAPDPAAPPAPPARTTMDYTVVPGDTIWDLGKTYGSSVDEIVGVNPQFRPGSGDSRYDADYERTLTTNRDADAIWPGEVLKIPVHAPPAPPVEAPPPPPPVEAAPSPPVQTAPPTMPHDPPPPNNVPPPPVQAAPSPTPTATTPPNSATPIQPPATNAACPVPTPYSPNADPLANAAMWGKQVTFATRVATRLGFEGLSSDPGRFPGPPAAAAPGSALNSVSKVVGLGGFGIFNGIQKSAEAINYARDGDWGRTVASGVEGLNGFRIGATGITPILNAVTKNGAATAWVNNNLGGAAGTRLGIGANVVAGAARAYSIEQQYQKTADCATTPREKDQAQYNRVDAHLGNALDTANDIVPYVGDNPVNWATWLGSKVMDHAATEMLEGSAYKSRSIGADHARNVMPLLAAAGAVPTIEHYDLDTARTADERIVMDESNSVHKAAGIGAGAADVTVTGTEVGLATRFGGGKAIYPVLQADHMLRQGANIWTDLAWQRPAEREAAVKAAGLDPALDPHKIEYVQEDFVHRTAASLSADVNIARLRGKVAAGGASAEEKRYLEIVKEFESTDINHGTNGRGSDDGFFSPHNMWEITKNSQPGMQNIEMIPDAFGLSLGWVQGGGIGKTVNAAERKFEEAKDRVVDFTRDAGKGLVNLAGNSVELAEDVAGGVLDFATAGPKKILDWL